MRMSEKRRHLSLGSTLLTSFSILTNQEDPDKIEKDVESVLPKERWRRFSDILIYHGREVCKARKPEHGHCAIFNLCPSNAI